AEALSYGIAESRLDLLAHGVEAPAQVASPTADAPARYVLFAGRLSVEKGVRLLPGLAAAIAPVPLLVAGEGPLGAWLGASEAPNLRRLGPVADAGLA